MTKPSHIIYRITNKANGKSYIGKHSTHNLDDNYMGSGLLIKKAIKKYGIENFKKEIIVFAKNIEELNRLEILYIRDMKPKYNIALGGTGGAVILVLKSNLPEKYQQYIEKLKNKTSPWVGKKHTIESRQKMSESAKNRPPNWPKNSRHTKEAKEKMSLAKIGCTPWNKGTYLSDKHRKNLSIAHIGNKIPQEISAKRNHTRWHTNRSIYKSTCLFCIKATT